MKKSCKKLIKKVWGIIFYTIVGVISLGVYIFIFMQPSNDRDWNDDQKVLAYAEFNGGEVKIFNIRNINYRSETDFNIEYYDKIFDLRKIKSVDYIVEPFSEHDGPAHTFLSFGFEGETALLEDDEFVSISVEIRKEKGESFSPLKGLLKQYEIMYVVADERDVVKLRTNFRKDKVYVYPIKTTKTNMRALFRSMLNRVNDLTDNPEFYNTIWNTCTTNIVSHVEEIAPNRIPLSYKILLPAFSDELAYDLGLIDLEGADLDENGEIAIEDLRKHFQINELAEKYVDAEDFSVKIRSGR